MFKKILVSLLTILSIAGTALTVTACNTVAGVGADVQKAGGAIKEEANEHK